MLLILIMPNFLVNTDTKLHNIMDDLQKSPIMGLDTEFIRESTYFPKLALLQLSDKNNTYCIDILEITENNLISELLVSEKIKKIIHASKQDLEVLNHYFNCYPKNIFDTQIAYNLLTPDVSISYSNLVKKYLNIELKEGSWRTDWLKRPLSDDKIEYAANDVKYLIKLYDILNRELLDSNRIDWFYEEQNIELKKSNIVAKPDSSWEKINLPSNITSTQLNYLKKISYWREDKAIVNDIPKRWIFSDSEIIKIVMSKPNKLSNILKNLKHSMNENDTNFIKSIINDKYIRPDSVNKNIDGNLYNERVNKCHHVLEKVALEHKLAPTLIASKRDIDAFARNKNYVKFLHGWRFKIFGKLLQ